MFKRLLDSFRSAKDTNPEPAYNLWAGNYDDQPGNLMLALDGLLFAELLAGFDLNGRVIVDIGCGTGRHWQKLLDRKPAKLLGFDVSEGMLDMLRHKFPMATTFRLRGNELPGLENASCDLVISTLTIAHIEDPVAALKEWNRVLKPGGAIIITDYHPEALAKGAKRTFKHGDRHLSIKNYIHPVEEIKNIGRQLGLSSIRSEENKVDETMRHYYEAQNAAKLFEQWKGVPIIYGIILKKADGPA